VVDFRENAMNALRPSLRNDSFVSFVAGILVAAMMLVGGPTAYAFTSRCPVPVSLPLICDGPPGTIVAPLGECEGEVTEADLVAIQTELWTSIFGTSEEPNLTYNLAPGSEFIGRGEYEGVNYYGVPFTIKVHELVQAFEPQVQEGDTLTAWHVFAEVTGPTAVAVPVVGVIMKIVPGSTSGTSPGMGFFMAGRMSDSMLSTIKFLKKNGVGNRPPGGPVVTQEQCMAACKNSRDAAILLATATYSAACATAAMAALWGTLQCAKTIGVPPFGTLLALACVAAVLIVLAVAIVGATAIFDAAIGVIEASYRQCLLGCGIVVV
jgi:hypothetical protein